jgi:hypothetical protein
MDAFRIKPVGLKRWERLRTVAYGDCNGDVVVSRLCRGMSRRKRWWSELQLYVPSRHPSTVQRRPKSR